MPTTTVSKVAFLVSPFVALLILLAVPAPAQTSTWASGSGAWSPCPDQNGTARWDTCNNKPGTFPNSSTANAIIQSGSVTATSALVANLTLDSGASLIFPPGQPSILDILGPNIVNNGSISLAGSDGLQIEGNGTVTLSGSGTVTLAGNALSGGNGQPTLISQQPIVGFGTLGNGGLTITNESTINVSGGTLNLQPSAAGMTNTGLIEVQPGSQLNLITGPFTNSGGTIQALDSSTILLQANISGGTISTSGSGHFTLAPPGAGAGLAGLTNAGTFDVPAGANLNWQGTISNTGIFNLNGSITATGASTVTLQGTGTVLMNGGQFGSLSATPMINEQLIHGGGTFYGVPLTNTATIQADNTSTQLVINGSSTTNKGHLQASGGGTLVLSTIVNNSGGTIQALGGSTVIFTNNFNGSINGGTLTTSGTGIIKSENGVLDGTINSPTNTGQLQADNFDLFLQGKVNNTGSISLIGNSCIILNQPSRLMGAGHVIMASTTCIFGSGLAFTNDNTIQGAGSIGDSNPMPITNNGTIFANQTNPLLIVPDASGFTNSGKLTTKAGSRLHINGLFNNLPSTGVLSGGVYILSGILELQNTITTNAANITLNGIGAEIFSDNTSANALATLATNASTGVLTIQGGQSLTTNTNLANTGKLTIMTASSLNAGGSYTQNAGTTLVDGTLRAPSGLVLNQGSLLGRGALASNVRSSAILVAGDSTSKAGRVTITGSYTQNSTGVLDVTIGGTTVGTQYSQLAVSNGASLSGTLNIKRLSSFIPAIGDVFTILTASALNNTKFATVNGTSINSTEHFQIGYTPTAVTLTVESGP